MPYEIISSSTKIKTYQTIRMRITIYYMNPRDKMLALVLYTGCDCNYDLCSSQRNGDYNKWTPDKANLTQAPWLETIDFVVFKDKREKRRLLSRIDIDKVQLEDIEIDYIIDFLNTLTDKNGNNRPIGRPESVPSGLPVD